MQNDNIIDEIIFSGNHFEDCISALKANHSAIQLIRQPHNMGIGAAVKSGIHAATGDIVVLVEADCRSSLDEITNLVQRTNEYDMVVGVRASKADVIWYRRLASSIFNSYANYMVGSELLGLLSGVRVFDAQIVHNMAYLIPDQQSYTATLTSLFLRAGRTIIYESLDDSFTQYEDDNNIFLGNLRNVLMVTEIALRFVPLRIFLPISTLFSLTGGFYVLVILATENRFSGFGGLVVTIGIFLFMFGLIAEQIALLRLVRSEG